MLMAKAYETTEMVHPVIIPFSKRCHADVVGPEVIYLLTYTYIA